MQTTLINYVNILPFENNNKLLIESILYSIQIHCQSRYDHSFQQAIN